MTTNGDYDRIQRIKEYCADIAERMKNDGGDWTQEEAETIAGVLNESSDPWELFRYIDEKTGSSDVGYRTRDGREWFHVLRQMRNTVGSGLFETLRPRYS